VVGRGGTPVTTTMQCMFQGWNMHTPGKYRELVFGIASEEIGHVDSNGNPWQGSFVTASGNLLADFTANANAEMQGRQQVARPYHMTDDHGVRDPLRRADPLSCLASAPVCPLPGGWRAGFRSGSRGC
jgi:Mn-containing catalase